MYYILGGDGKEYGPASADQIREWIRERRANAQTRIRADVFNLFDARTNDITYYYTSRLRGEPAPGVNDHHFHPSDPRTFRVGLLYNF